MKLEMLTRRPLIAAVLLGSIALSFGCWHGTDATEPPAAEATADSKAPEATPAKPSETTVAKPPEAAPATPSEAAAAKAPEAKPEPADASTFPVPEETPAQLLAFLDGLKTMQPPARDPESMKAFLGKLGRTAVLAAERILAAKPSKEEAGEAVQYKLAGLALMDQAGDPSVAAKRAALPAELKAAGFETLVRTVELDGFVSR